MEEYEKIININGTKRDQSVTLLTYATVSPHAHVL